MSYLRVAGVVVHETSAKLSEVEVWDRGVANKNAVVNWQEEAAGGLTKSFFTVRSNELWSRAKEASPIIELRRRRFDPLEENLEWFSGPSQTEIIQFRTQPLPEYLEELRRIGVRVYDYVHNNSYVASVPEKAWPKVRKLPYVRWLGQLMMTDKLAESAQRLFTQGMDERSAYHVVPVSLAQREEVETLIVRTGGALLTRDAGGFVAAELLPAEVMALLSEAVVLWVEAASGEPEEDMDVARMQGGADFLEANRGDLVAGYTGRNMKGHVLEGIYPDHPDFAANEYRDAPVMIDDGTSSTHGHSTFGIIFGSGEGNSKARGLLPNAQGYYTNYDVIQKGDPSSREKGTRYELVKRLIDEHQIMFQTASWGYPTTEEYTSRSLEMDRLIFELDIPITQSMSNTGDRRARPQAWAKNIISVGAIYHFETPDQSDDKWDGSEIEGRSAVGPTSDGRVKPDLCGNFDSIFTTSFEGYMQFGGTSGATPMVAGYLGLAIELWTNGTFNNLLVYDVTERFQNRPHFTTAKALLINTANQYAFSGEDHDLNRMHQGWGFPNVKNMFENRERIFVINEDVVLRPLGQYGVGFVVEEGTPELRLTMVYSDPPGGLVNRQARVNNLDMMLEAPDGTKYWGNFGLRAGIYSQAGGQPDRLDTVENIFLKDPQSGTWFVTVIADELNQDGHPETEKTDADFALVINGLKQGSTFKSDKEGSHE